MWTKRLSWLFVARVQKELRWKNFHEKQGLNVNSWALSKSIGSGRRLENHSSWFSRAVLKALECPLWRHCHAEFLAYARIFRFLGKYMATRLNILSLVMPRLSETKSDSCSKTENT